MKISGNITIEDDDDDDRRTPGRPNAWWAAQREQDNFGGAFRGVPAAPHGGSITVRPEDTIGGEDCWCGLLFNHYWPGKSQGLPHPRGEAMNAPDLNRSKLKAYHRSLQDFILLCIADGLRWKMLSNKVMLYPSDGTQAITVHARANENQLKSLQQWYAKHVYLEEQPAPEPPASDEQLAALAEAKNNPAEHPKPEPKPAPPKQESGQPVVTWTPYVKADKSVSKSIQISSDGRIRCIKCKGTEHEFLAGRNSIGGHKRVYHSDTSTMYGSEARSKATETRQENKRHAKFEQLLDDMCKLFGYELIGDADQIEKLEQRITELEDRVASTLKERDAAIARADEAQARLDLLKEALNA